jgi:hypothetical protein
MESYLQFEYDGKIILISESPSDWPELGWPIKQYQVLLRVIFLDQISGY